MREMLATMSSVSSSDLVDALDTLGVPFLLDGTSKTVTLEPGILLAALAASPEARLRMSLIPLLLAHPEFAEDVETALGRLSADAAIVLRCYYTAAHWLQAKYRTQIVNLRGDQPVLPDLFSEELGLPGESKPDIALHALAFHQQRLTGRIINWLGTYEHAAQNWLRFVEHEDRWQHSPRITSTHS